MSAPQYVYIPNLVGRQMLRIPILACEEEPTTTVAPSVPQLRLDTTSTSMAPQPYSRDSSPAPSVDSVEEIE